VDCLGERERVKTRKILAVFRVDRIGQEDSAGTKGRWEQEGGHGTDLWCELVRCRVHSVGNMRREKGGTVVDCAFFGDAWVREDINLG
jgi:hypothetical protein